MDKELKKIYSKAMLCYQKGLIDKALNCCEKGISKDIYCAPILNLKGLLLYQKGDLEGCRVVWNINADINDDGASKEYLKDSKRDSDRLKLYSNAMLFIKEMRINEALENLKKCRESDFNIINVSNALASCYIKKGEYIHSEYHIEKVLELDKYNKEALSNKEYLKKFGNSSTKDKLLNNKMILRTTSIILGICIVILSLRYLIIPKVQFLKNPISLFTSSKDAKKGSNDKVDLEKDNKAPIKGTEGKSSDDKKTSGDINKLQNNESKFSQNEIKTDLEHKNYDKLYNVAMEFKDSKLNVNEKALYNKVLETLETEGVNFFYSQGMKFQKEKDYVNAQKELEKAFKHSNKSYLKSHIIYMLGASAENRQDIESAIKYYKLYAEEYLSSEYGDGVLYNLAVLNKNINNYESYKYASMIKSNFPNSMYFNTTIKDILKSK
ncbi:hypothetical protein SAMN05444401_2526 [Clostridium amylolyticum]|uniref:Tetratricopeptide repeat-containing protein n=1 Tax=Clostridium amylolyticum TaxID=1121298 RepID=A0A1M6HHQ1_9CLOT|nr:hypothetical protein [Clostridium amylolyticum]SHJ21766.1 hypothetical protein SAMN05444401_2526 [Clostridium amylolyticum]